MPASTVVPASTPSLTGTRTPQADASRDADASGRSFERQLDAARQQQGKTSERGGHPDAGQRMQATRDGRQPADPARAARAAASATATAAERTTAITDPADDAANDADADTDADADRVAQWVGALLGPVPGTALPPMSASGGAPGRGAAAALAVGSGVLGAGPLRGAASAASDAVTGAALDGADADPARQTWVLDRVSAPAPIPMSIPLSVPLPVVAEVRASATVAADPGIATLVAMPAAAPDGVHLLQVAAPVGTPGFSTELGNQVMWLGTQDVKQARIRLHPEELGQLDVQVSVTHGRVDVVFSAQHPGAVQALQQGLPQLDQMLAQQGLALGHAEVGQHGRDGSSGSHGGNGEARIDGAEEIHPMSAATPVRALNLLDAFA